MTLAATLALVLCAAPQPTAFVVESLGDAPTVDYSATFEFVPSLDIETAVEPQRSAALSCAGDADCVAGVFAPRYTRAVVAVIEAQRGSVAVAVDVVDVTRRQLLARHFAELDPNTRDPVYSIAGELFAALDAAGHPGHGALRLELAPPDARASVDGTLLTLPRAVLPPGDHRVRVEADDHESTDLDVHIVPGVETTEAITLAPEDDSSTWVWIGVGATALIAGGVIAAIAASSSEPDTMRRLCQRPSGGAACDAP